MIDKALSLSAILIAIFALLFGGYFAASWTKEVSKPVISIVVDDIQNESEEPPERRIEVPADLRDKSRRAIYFPTLKRDVTSSELEEYLRTYEEWQQAVQVLEQTVAEVGREENPRDPKEAWSDVSPEIKSLLFTFRTARIRRTLSEGRIDVSAHIDSLLETTGKPVEERVLREPTTLAALQDFLVTARDLELAPTRTSVLAVIQEDIGRMKDAVGEFASFEYDLKQLLKVEDSETASQGGAVVWRVDVVIYNTGLTPVSLAGTGALIVERQPGRGGDNEVLVLEGADEWIPVPSGEAVALGLRAVRDSDYLVQWFQSGDKSFVLVMRDLGGSYVTSDVYDFSEGGISAKSAKELLGHAQSVDIHSLLSSQLEAR